MPAVGNGRWPRARGNVSAGVGVTKFASRIKPVTLVTAVTPFACVFVEVSRGEVGVSASVYVCACGRYHRYLCPLSLSISLKEKEKYRVTVGVTVGVTPTLSALPAHCTARRRGAA